MSKSANMKVDSSLVDKSASVISSKGAAIENSYKEVFKALRAIDAVWDGEDNNEYNERFKSFEKDFLELTTFLNKMVNHLQLTAKAYNTIESATTKTAQKLSF